LAHAAIELVTLSVAWLLDRSGAAEGDRYTSQHLGKQPQFHSSFRLPVYTSQCFVILLYGENRKHLIISKLYSKVIQS
jgi:hypothetical protein